ncbi:Glutathione synthase/Ribosomal protein S6 modification enzyme (glutaminyl transferase) [Thiorhodovibrio winogradskyi]|uniref:Glutathione synthase/Ribosomal protein S6 modification enzyme (Glutaminyl transferase) n=1 Tax=Thiorhodovibrio winogradskyi TaxID=77007 RepID=A0ABZ0SE32_9GAMM|nr:RimK family alpha-L-glutamate ligase [Thiorhodovibrio winogradskyi]
MQDILGLAALLRRHLSGEDLGVLGQSLLDQATQNPEDAAALLDASTIIQFRGDAHLALQLQAEALKLCRTYRIPAAKPVRTRVLAIMAPGAIMGNVPLECLLEDSDIELLLYFASATTLNPSHIPEHDLLFVAIGESDANRPILNAWRPLIAGWPRPVVNAPGPLDPLSRDLVYQGLRSLPGLSVPPTDRVARAALENGPPATLAFPLILRPTDSHAGQDMVKLDSPEDLTQALTQMPGDAFFVSPFIDYRSPDGRYRKYRLVFIQGRPFACHMAVSDTWMIHYLNAGMAESAEKRAEEAAFMANFNQGFATRHSQALAAIQQAVGLDYFGIDCAESADGRLLVFEVDAAMVVHAMDPFDIFPYKQPAMADIFAAFRVMLLEAAERKPPSLTPTTQRATQNGGPG